MIPLNQDILPGLGSSVLYCFSLPSAGVTEGFRGLCELPAAAGPGASCGGDPGATGDERCVRRGAQGKLSGTFRRVRDPKRNPGNCLEPVADAARERGLQGAWAGCLAAAALLRGSGRAEATPKRHLRCKATASEKLGFIF